MTETLCDNTKLVLIFFVFRKACQLEKSCSLTGALHYFCYVAHASLTGAIHASFRMQVKVEPLYGELSGKSFLREIF